MLADASPVTFSVSAGCDCWSCSREIGESTGDCSRSRSSPSEVEILLKGVVAPVRGLGGRMIGLASHALVPRTVRGLVDETTLAVTRHAPFLPVYGLGGSGLALGVTIRGLNDCARVRLAVAPFF